MKMFKETRGTLTVEAAISLPIFIAFVVVLASIIKVVYVHNEVQYGLNQSAKELSNYFYIYSASGLQKAHDTANTALQNSQKDFTSHFVDIMDSFNTGGLIDKAGSVKEAMWDKQDSIDLATDKEGAYKAFKKITKKKVLSPISFFALAAFDEGKEVVGNVMIQFLIDKHFSIGEQSAEERFKNLEIINGIDGLTYHSNILEDNKSIEVIVTYDVKPIVPYNWFPKVHLANRTIVKALLDGNGKYAKK